MGFRGLIVWLLFFSYVLLCSCRSSHHNGGTTRRGLGDILTKAMFEKMLPNANNDSCPAKGFYTYEAFIAAAKSYPAFATTGSHEIRKREVAAFLGQTSFQTAGGIGWTPSIGPYTWGYCTKKTDNPLTDYCQPNPRYPCAAGRNYYGRGPMQLSWNYNYGKFGETIGRKKDLLQNPDLLIKNVTMAFEAAIWFWMTPQPPKPSPHDVIIGNWHGDNEGRLPGYGVISNIIDHEQCGIGADTNVQDRILYYQRYCDMLGVGYGENTDCYSQKPYPAILHEN
ncbi:PATHOGENESIS-RELATED 3, basic chitinase [Hibiscus trionum]|uniref:PATHOGENESIS-RELATED 3, basic chitinase n=1 Tax=Hibiscus trionum TaxID=183268 RepID=A0A9W7MPC1_HIBTR|nr:PATHOGENESIS-RELATED 3, basic chitinase [Hibiscus trionum]